MKILKVVGLVLAAILTAGSAISPHSPELKLTGEYQGPKIEPTPIGQQMTTDETDSSESSLCSSISDYDGRIKQETYTIHGDTWTVVHKVGSSFQDMQRT